MANGLHFVIVMKMIIVFALLFGLRVQALELTCDGKGYHSIVNCKEILPNGHPDSADFSFDGKSAYLKPGGIANCSKFVNFSEVNLYDSKKFQIQAPIIYIQGVDDPATPRLQAIYHYQNQGESARKAFFNVPNGSHTPLNSELKACSSNFWSALARNPKEATRTFSPCIGNTSGIDSTTPNKAVR